MLKFKKVIGSFILSIAVITMNLSPALVKADEIQLTNESTVTSKQQGYTLLWRNVQDGKVLEKVSVGKTDFTYTYNNNQNRLSKTSEKETIIFNYDNESRLISEVRGDNKFTYLYDSLNSLVGFTLNNTTYNFDKDDDFNIIAITDVDNNYVAKYEYDKNGFVSAILGKDISGKWVDMSNDSSFIGTLNLYWNIKPH